MIADTLTLVSIALSGLGAGGVLWPGIRAVRRAAREGRRRRDTREMPREFFYRRQVVALRIVARDRSYIHRREAHLVSRVPWGSRPFGEIEIVDERLCSNHPAVTLSLVDADANVDQEDGWERRYIRFSQPLRRREEIAFAHVQTAEVVGNPLKHCLRWSPVTRCDHITLQVAFAADPPAEVRYTVHSCTGEELEWAAVELDEITGAFTMHVDNPIPGRYYKLAWKYS